MANKIESQRKALVAAKAALEKHAEEVAVLDVAAVSSVSDYFVIGTANSRPQLAAIVDAVEQALRRHGDRVWHIEGLAPSGLHHDSRANGFAWVLIDCGDVVMHLFNPPARTFYHLERLWADAPRLPLEALV